jgi:citrate lyase beta subunit
MHFGDQFRLTLLTNDPVLAAKADRAGVDRTIGLDLERAGKAERQAGHNARLSDHRVEELPIIAASLRSAQLFVRTNSLNSKSSLEIETVLSAGATVVMLPYFRTAKEVERFVGLVQGRASVVILVETKAAVKSLREILRVGGIGEVMIGLNDLRLETGVRSHFELLASPLLDRIAAEVRGAGLPLSIGGVTRPDDPSVPLCPDLVLAQYPRLGATGAWIARCFVRSLGPESDLVGAVASIRRRLTEWAAEPDELLGAAQRELSRRARGAIPEETSLAVISPANHSGQLYL